MAAAVAAAPAELLDAWERARPLPPGERALALLAVAEPSCPRDELAGWTVGRRHGALLAWRGALFGPSLTTLTDCPSCGEAVEATVAVADLVLDARPAADAATSPAATGEVTVEGYTVGFQAPTAGDLAALAREVPTAAPDGAAEAWLLERCVLRATGPGGPCAAADLPEAVVAELVASVAAVDPGADVALAVGCPACATEWAARLDVVGFLSQELDAWAARLVGEVHALARAYGWTEPDVLALSPGRRRRYLELVAG